MRPGFKKKTKVDPRVKDQQNVINKKLKKPLIKSKYKALFEIYAHKNEIYTKNRGYKAYNLTFLRLLDGKPLLEFIQKRFKNKSKIRILDEGAGLTRFLKEFKTLLKNKGIESETSAITLTPGVTRENVSVDLLIKQKSQEFQAFKEYDLITSVFGGVHYNIAELDKNLVLKFSHSLSKNGVFLLGVNRLKTHENIDVEKHIKNISTSLKKNGFKLDFKYVPINGYASLPNYIFKIERL